MKKIILFAVSLLVLGSAFCYFSSKKGENVEMSPLLKNQSAVEDVLGSVNFDSENLLTSHALESLYQRSEDYLSLAVFQKANGKKIIVMTREFVGNPLLHVKKTNNFLVLTYQDGYEEVVDLR